MNALILNGSPRAKGNTASLLKEITKEVSSTFNHVDSINLADLSINACIGCGHCGKKGVCIFKDDMTELYSRCSNADTLILASPIYFYSVTSQTKLFIDRCQVFWSRKYILCYPPRKKYKGKGYFVSVAAKKGEKTFQGAELTIKYLFDALDINYSGSLFIKGFDEPGSVLNSQQTLDDVKGFARTIK